MGSMSLCRVVRMLIKYPKDYNPIREYWELIESAQDIVPNKIRRTYKKLVQDLDIKVSEYFYSNSRANHFIEITENFCKHSKGKMGGRPVILELWEKAL